MMGGKDNGKNKGVGSLMGSPTVRQGCDESSTRDDVRGKQERTSVQFPTTSCSSPFFFRSDSTCAKCSTAGPSGIRWTLRGV